MAITQLHNRIPDQPITQTFPEGINKPQLPAQPIWKSESSITKCETYEITSLSKKSASSTFGCNAKPFLMPPSKELVIRASEAVQIFATTKNMPGVSKQPKVIEEELNSQETDEETRQQEQEELALEFQLQHEMHNQESAYIAAIEDEEAYASITRRRNVFNTKRSEKTGKEPLKELLALVTEHEASNKEEMAKEEDSEELTTRELRKQEVAAKERTSDPEREIFQSIHDYRKSIYQNIDFGMQEVSKTTKYSHDLHKEQTDLYLALKKRSKIIKSLKWIAKGANIFAGASAIVVAAVALASGGAGAAFAVIPAGAKLVDAGATLSAGVIGMKNKQDQAKLLELREHRSLASAKVQDLFSGNQLANRTIHILWKTMSDILKNRAKITTFN